MLLQYHRNLCKLLKWIYADVLMAPVPTDINLYVKQSRRVSNDFWYVQGRAITHRAADFKMLVQIVL